MKIIVGAVSTQEPYSGGNQVNWLHWIEGLQRLGHEVYFVEQVGAKVCVDVKGTKCDFAHSVVRSRFLSTLAQFRLPTSACLIYENGQDTAGLSLSEISSIAKDADLLINFSGCLSASVILENVRCRAYIDTDPVYTQIWHTQYDSDLNLATHDVHFTFGLNIGTPFSPVPDCGLQWSHLRRPMVLDMWPYDINPSCKRFTTVATWKVFGDICYRGQWYRSKAYELERFITIPELTEQGIEIALREPWDNESADKELRNNGWIVIDADSISNLQKYKDYIMRSRAELGIAKNAYVRSSSGWFSDRAAHYLSCGKPVLHQSTGFERVLPTGYGILSFSDIDEALAGIDEINSDYAKHCHAARDFAEEYLDYRKIIPEVIDQCMRN